MNITHKKIKFFSFLICIILLISSCNMQNEIKTYVTVNDNVPQFAKTEITVESFESYSNLDHLDRCGPATACIGKDIMPTEERGSIGQIKPSGWQLVKYDIIDGKYLYNRCHLIGYQLSGENANEKNLITGTRYMNVDGMLPFENMVASYVEETENHVMYRVTPVFTNNNLLADGVQIEAFSVEDNGKGISFNVFVFNIQPGIEINYLDGTSKLINEANDIVENNKENNDNRSVKNHNRITYILNNSTKKFHYSSCPSVNKIKQKNREEYDGNIEYLVENDYSPCGVCIGK